MNTPLLFGRHMYLDLKEGVSLVQVDSRLQEVHPWQHEDGDLSLSELVKNNSIVWIPKSNFSVGRWYKLIIGCCPFLKGNVMHN